MIAHANRCPFCGGNNLRMTGFTVARCAVECVECEVAGPCRKTEEEAVAAWDHRPLEYRDSDFEPIMHGHWKD
jgi:hypothetical protein